MNSRNVQRSTPEFVGIVRICSFAQQRTGDIAVTFSCRTVHLRVNLQKKTAKRCVSFCHHCIRRQCRPPMPGGRGPAAEMAAHRALGRRRMRHPWPAYTRADIIFSNSSSSRVPPSTYCRSTTMRRTELAVSMPITSNTPRSSSRGVSQCSPIAV